MPPQSWAVRQDSWAAPRAEDAPVAPTAPVPFWGSVERSYEDGWETRRRNARYEATDQALWDRHRHLEQRLGRKLPMSRSLAGVTPEAGERTLLDRIIDPEAINAAILGRPGLLEDDAYEAMIEGERRKTPAAFDGIETGEQISTRLDAQFRATRERADVAAGSGWAGGLGAFVGQAGAALSDPANLGTAIATGGWGAGRPLLARMAIQGGIGGGQELLDAPQRGEDARRFGGPEYTAGEAGLDVLFGAAGGAGFEAGGAVMGRGWRAARGRFAGSAAPGERGFARAVDRLLEDEAAIGPTDDFDGARGALDRGDPPPPVTPERSLDDLFGSTQPREVSAGVSRSQPEPGGLVSAEYRGRQIWAGRFDPLQLEVDAARFQYKADGDGEGVTNRLSGIERWDATASGKVILFEDTDGRMIVADGHQRRGLARRLAEKGWEDAQMDGYLFRAADGWTPEQVRVVAAAKNLREGSGTIMDAAKLFRDAPALLEDRSLPITGEFIQQARHLARLNDEAFRAVINGNIPERYGAALGELAGDRPDLQADMVALLQKADPRSIEGARSLIQESMLDDFITTEGLQGDLFGSLPRESTLIARGQVREAVLAGLRRDARIHAQLVKHADTIEAGGNRLARGENEARLQLDRVAGELVSRLALRSGDIGEAFTKAAEDVTLKRSTVAAATRGLIQRIRAAVEGGELAEMRRAEALTPRPPSAAAREAAATFDTPGGAGQKAQATPKPEDQVLEAVPMLRGRGPDPVEVVATAQRHLAAWEAKAAASRAVLETRSEGVQYHGATGPISKLEEGYANDANIYGSYGTFYTTDAADIAVGYGRKNPASVLYSVKERAAVQFFDMEKGQKVGDWERLLKLDATTADVIGLALDEVVAEVGATPNLRQIMDEARALSRGEGLSRSDLQEYFDGIIEILQEQGYGGMRHVGGLRTKRPPHEVKIYFKPHEQIEIEAVPVPRADVPADVAASITAAAERVREAEAIAAKAAEAESARPGKIDDTPPSGLFDDLADEESGLTRAITHLTDCTPGKG